VFSFFAKKWCKSEKMAIIYGKLGDSGGWSPTREGRKGDQLCSILQHCVNVLNQFDAK